MKNTVLHGVVDFLAEDDFYAPAHRAIYRAILELYRRNAPIDLITTAEQLQAAGDLEGAGGAAYLGELAESVIGAANATYYARLVRDKALQRQLIGAATEIIQSSFDAGQDVGELLDKSEQSIFAISERTTSQSFRSSKELVAKVFSDLEKRVERKELVTGVPTGYHKLDELTAGFQPSDLIIVAGRPSMGKTAFALNVAMRAAVLHQVPILIFSLEMSMDQLMQRMLCSWGKVDLARLRRGFLDDGDWSRLYDAADALSGAPVFIDDTPALSTLDLRARSRRMRMEHGVGLVVVDYLQLMRSSRYVDSREQEISDISRNLKALAKELDVPMVALSQLNRKVEDRTNKRPQLADLRESGAIEQDADVILFLYRDEVYNKREDNPRKGIAEIIVGKQRNGPTGDVNLAYLNRFTAFEELSADFQPPPSEAMD